MNIYSIEGAVKALGKERVLRGIDLRVNRGEVLSLVGPSGSGKSTLLRAMNRLIEIDSGRIDYRGTPIGRMHPVDLRRKAVLVPQEAVMLPGTVGENVLYGPKLAGIGNECDVGSYLEEAGLPGGFGKRDASKLSGGERKRVSLARALALRPEVLLLDEPTAGVDPKKVERMERTILDSARSRSLTVVWVTHDIPQAMRVSDRIANLKLGKVVNVGVAKDFRWEGAY